MPVLLFARRIIFRHAPILFACALLVAPSRTSAQSVTVFGRGTISIEGGNIFKGAFAPDGGAFYFFRKVSASGEDYRIFVSRHTDAGWGQAERVVIGSDGVSDLYPAISPDGKWLVFSSYRPAGGAFAKTPNANLWMAPMTEDGPGEPRLLKLLSTPGNYHPGPAFDTEGNLHYKSTTPDWATTVHRVASMQDGRFDGFETDTRLDPWKDWRAGEVFVWDGVPQPGGNLMMLDVSEIGPDGRRSMTDQWVSMHTINGWSAPVKLGLEVNTDGSYENFVVFSPDGKKVYFDRDFETYYEMSVDEVITAVGG